MTYARVTSAPVLPPVAICGTSTNVRVRLVGSERSAGVCVASSIRVRTTQCVEVVRQTSTGASYFRFLQTPITNVFNIHLFDVRRYRCDCAAGTSGSYCEVIEQTTCAAARWGPPICGPCNCDAEKGFNTSCDRLTGQCSCLVSSCNSTLRETFHVGDNLILFVAQPLQTSEQRPMSSLQLLHSRHSRRERSV